MLLKHSRSNEVTLKIWNRYMPHKKTKADFRGVHSDVDQFFVMIWLNNTYIMYEFDPNIGVPLGDAISLYYIMTLLDGLW